MEEKNTTNVSSSSSSEDKSLIGMKIRDEFICPITYEIFREPVVASDGFTYERNSIEKWLKTNNTSPKTKEPISQILTTNFTFKKLIQDLIHEGGTGLYTEDRDAQAHGRRVQISKGKVLLLNCVGPDDSDWYNKSFTVTPDGCIGGRQQTAQDVMSNRLFVQFTDSVVSRRHFHIDFFDNDYYLRDLGSQGGCFVMVDKKKELHPGIIIMFGKHQFMVSSIVEVEENDTSNAKINNNIINNTNNNININNNRNRTRSRSKSGTTNENEALEAMLPECEGMMREAQELLTVLNDARSQGTGAPRIEQRLMQIHGRLVQMSSSQVLDNYDDENDHNDDHNDNNLSGIGELDSEHNVFIDYDSNARSKSYDNQQYSHHIDNKLDNSDSDAKLEVNQQNNIANRITNRNQKQHKHMRKRLTLTCFFPDGSPIKGQSFVIDSQGASIGRAPSNDISLSLKLNRPEKGGGASNNEGPRWTSIDPGVSSEHAYIELDSVSGNFYICDGSRPRPYDNNTKNKSDLGEASIPDTARDNSQDKQIPHEKSQGKPSLNGTWFRLSGPHQESPQLKLDIGMQILIGGLVRFRVSEGMTIFEKSITRASNKISNKINNSSGSGSGSGRNQRISSGDEWK